MITGVSSDGLGKEWLGCILDHSSLERLNKLASKYRFHVDGEGGEYETLVVAGPHMKGELSIDFDIEWDGVRGHLNFL
jgi:diphthamide synthase (EF-2-diphthine--ammonia ligase)